MSIGIGIGIGLGQGSRAGVGIPYTFNPASLPDGSFLSPWTGSSTFSILSGQIINDPALGDDLVSNGNMETGDPPTGWTPTTCTPSSQADERTGGSGSKCIRLARNGANSLYVYQLIAGPALYGWARVTGWAKRVTVSHGVNVMLDNSTLSSAIWVSNTDWTQVVRDGARLSGASAMARAYGTSTGADGTYGHVDDLSIQTYTSIANLLKCVNAGKALVNVKATFTGDPMTSGMHGVACCVDNPLNPLNFVASFLQAGQSTAFPVCITTIKVVNGVPSVVAAEAAKAYVAGAGVEIWHIATNTFQVFYAGTQVGSDLTISDVGIVSNLYHGIIAGKTGAGSGIDAFFLQ